ncbi:MAG: NUDIX hydrolase [Paracoccaceae bacterium]|uniref:NUDIX hydrolase n=1 Tax=Seohaeicola saemankumensis TaxID=481181 RepID=UPI001E3D0AF0|nr:NUDIX hydrolase [Seohaeicola saemankumensis]MCD1626791.1 NUDIX hydrolase [Seohaeicola saemankumensis]
MMNQLKAAWTGMVQPLLSRPKRLQVAALCLRDTDAGREVLLITSRDTGRWILPKGWPIDGLTAPGAALQEAWEEAGVKTGTITEVPLGSYDYDKRLEGGVPVSVEVKVYAVEDVKLMDSYPEVEERNRRWLSPSEAAGLVDEPGLQDILQQL